MFFKIFYKVLVALVLLFGILTGICIIYAITNLSFIDITIISMIFLGGISVGIGLIKFYGNAIIVCKIDCDNIILTNMKGSVFCEKREYCTKIISKPNKVIMEFNNNSKYYICKNYLFNKSFFDFSLFNNDNFKNAHIIN